MFKVDIYIETDGRDKKERYRTYAAIVEFMTKSNETVTRQTHGMERASWEKIMLSAIISALNILTKPCKVTVHMAECRYVTETICQGRMYEWLANGWKTIRSEPIKYRGEWEEIIRLMKKHKITFAINNTHSYSNVMQGDIKKLKGQGMDWQQQEIGQ